MGAGVRIDDRAYRDERIEMLADLLGLAGGRWHALGLISRLWKRCTETQHYTLGVAFVRDVLGATGPYALLHSGLAELVGAHLPTKWQRARGGALDIEPEPVAEEGEPVLRLRGTEGRIEWYGQRVAAASAGGHARVAAIECRTKAGAR